MSIINIIDKRVEEEMEQLDEELEEKPIDIKKGIGFMLYSLKQIFKNLNYEELTEGITDSSFREEKHDYSIDAIYVTANGNLLTTKEEAEADYFNEDTKFTFHIMQFKKGSGIDQSTLLKFKEGIKTAFIQNQVEDDLNLFMYEKFMIINEIKDYLFENFDPKQILIKPYVCFSGIKDTVVQNQLL